MSRKNQRKTVIVDGATQLRIVLSTSLPMFACLVLSTFVELSFMREVNAGRVHADVTILGFPARRLGMLCFFVTASTAQLLTALIASHRVVGTAYRIGQVLRQFREGNRAARVRLRKGDYQQSLATDVNELLDWVQGGAVTLDATPSHDAGAGSDAETPRAIPSARPPVKTTDPRTPHVAATARKDG
jgi:hypothetical protein